MARTKPKYMLIEHGRYFYQRKVPLNFQAAVGRKKWHSPLGDDFDAAYGRLKEIRAEHDALIAKLKAPEERRDYKAAKRREREAEQNARIAAEEAAYDRWCGANGVKTDQEEYQAFLEENGLEEIPVWEKAERWLEAFEHERNRRRSPSQDEFESVQDLLKRLSRAAPNKTTRIELPPYPEFKALVSNASDTAKSIVTFASFLPEPMDDDEYHDRLVDIHGSLFGDHVVPPSDPEERDLFDFAKMKLERRIARLARNPDTISKVAAKFYRFAQLRKKTQGKYERTISRFIVSTGDVPVGQVSPRMLRDYRDKLKARGLLPSSIRSAVSHGMV